MYINSFDDFATAVQSMYEADPLNTRCVVKFRNVDAVVDIKVTNDKECLKFKTDQQQDLKRFEKLSKQLFRTMADIPADFVEPEETATPQAAAVAQSPNVAAASSKKGGKRK